MSEKKNMVIKVKYPTPGKIAAKPMPAKGVVTEWNFKRIALALASALLLMMAFFYFIDSNDDNKSVPTAELAAPEQRVVDLDSPPDQDLNHIGKPAEHSPTANDKPQIASAKSVARTQITSDIKNNEPVDNIPLPIKIGKNETLWLYYFVELKGMKGQTVYHEWWLNGEMISRKKVNISDDPWRTSSKQMITYTHNNDWVVRLVDDSRNKLNEKSFNLQLK